MTTVGIAVVLIFVRRRSSLRQPLGQKRKSGGEGHRDQCREIEKPIGHFCRPLLWVRAA